MFFRQFYLGCLAHASYMIGSDGEAAVVDPQRDVDEYLDTARQEGLSIRHVIETHVHADFVSGHRELAERTRGKIYFGWKSEAKFAHVAVHEGDEIRMGGVRLRFLETPGHTPESISIVVYDTARSAEPQAVLTGDTLFIGDVGRPDLVGGQMSTAELAGMLYDSLHEKLLKLPDHVEVFPAHGAGSMCGRNISSERSSTIGQERRFNYALRKMTRDEFVRMMTVDLPERPAYFSVDAEINRAGPQLLDKLPAPMKLSAAEVDRLRGTGYVVLDVRPVVHYGTGHVPEALHIGLNGQFASWAGTLIPTHAEILIVAEDDSRVREATTRLARVGLENVRGYLAGGLLDWHDAGLPLATTEQIPVDELYQRLREPGAPLVVDVRRPAEWEAGHIPGAVHLPLTQLAATCTLLEHGRRYAIVCASGYRSSIAASLLEQCGYDGVTNVVGGMTAWTAAKLPVERSSSESS